MSRIQVSGNITTTIGTPTPIHCTNPICTPSISLAAPANTAFGGVPISVALPPIDAAYAMPSMSAIPNSYGPSWSCGRNISPTAMPIGNIMAAVAVLLIHIERNAVAIMNPSTSWYGPVPTHDRIDSAILLCRPHRSIVTAMKKPPMNRKIRSFAYGADAAGASRMPKNGNSTSGRIAVAGIGIASVIHQNAIKTATAAVRQPSTDRPSGAGNTSIATNPAAPPMSPMRCAMPYVLSLSGWSSKGSHSGRGYHGSAGASVHEETPRGKRTLLMRPDESHYIERTPWPHWADAIFSGAIVLTCFAVLTGSDTNLSAELRLSAALGLLVFGLALRWTVGGLTVRVGEEGILLHLGSAPVLRRRVAFDEIRSLDVVRYRPILEFGGWGIRGLGKTKAWTARGNQAVRLHLTDDRELYVGSDVPHRLAERIRTIGGVGR